MKNIILIVTVFAFSTTAFANTVVEILPGAKTTINASEVVEVTCKDQSEIPVCLIKKFDGKSDTYRISLGETPWDDFFGYETALSEVKKLRSDGFCK